MLVAVGRPNREVNDRCAWRVQDLELPEAPTRLTLGSSNTAAGVGAIRIPISSAVFYSPPFM